MASKVTKKIENWEYRYHLFKLLSVLIAILKFHLCLRSITAYSNFCIKGFQDSTPITGQTSRKTHIFPGNKRQLGEFKYQNRQSKNHKKQQVNGTSKRLHQILNLYYSLDGSQMCQRSTFWYLSFVMFSSIKEDCWSKISRLSCTEPR